MKVGDLVKVTTDYGRKTAIGIVTKVVQEDISVGFPRVWVRDTSGRHGWTHSANVEVVSGASN